MYSQQTKVTKKLIQGHPVRVVSKVDEHGWYCEIFRDDSTEWSGERVGDSGSGHNTRLSAIRAAHRSFDWDMSRRGRV